MSGTRVLMGDISGTLGEGGLSTLGLVNHALGAALALLFLGSVLKSARIPLVVASWGAIIVLPLAPLRILLAAIAAVGILLIVRPDARQIPRLLLAAAAGGVASLGAVLFSAQVADGQFPELFENGRAYFIAGVVAAVLSSFAFFSRGNRRACIAMALVGASVSLPLAVNTDRGEATYTSATMTTTGTGNSEGTVAGQIPEDSGDGSQTPIVPAGAIVLLIGGITTAIWSLRGADVNKERAG